MKALTFAGLLATLFLSGCIYDTALESKPTEKADPKFAGTWRQVDDKDTQMFIRVFDEKQYVVAMVDGKALDLYRGFTSQVEGIQFANMQTLAPGKSGDGKWTFFEIRFNTAGQLVIRLINEKVISPKLTKPKELRAAIRANLKNPDLFLKATTYSKVDAKKR